MKKLTKAWEDLTYEVMDTIEYKIESISMDIAIQIYKKMNELNINQTQLAHRLNVNKSYISQLLKGKTNLTIESLVKISEALNLKTEIYFSAITDNASDNVFNVVNDESKEIINDSIENPIPLPGAIAINTFCTDIVWRNKNENIATLNRACSNIQSPYFSI